MRFVIQYLACWLLFATTIDWAGAQSQTPDGCFQISHQQQVSCGTFAERRTPMSELDCQNLCKQFSTQCYVAQYSIQLRQCDLFFSSVAGIRVNRRRRKRGSYGRRYRPYRQHRYQTPQPVVTNRCAGGPTATNCVGYKLFVPSGRPGCATTNPFTNGPITQRPFTPFPTTLGPTGPLPDEALCPAGTVKRFTQIDGVRVRGNDDVQFNTNSETECLTACAENRLPDGRQAGCVSAELYQGVCVLSLNAFAPLGSGEKEDVNGAVYYEKICVNAQSGALCQGPYERVPQFILVGFAEQVVPAVDFDDCVQQCIDAQEVFGQECSSGMIYYDEADLNCILNTETKDSQPELFLFEENDSVDYFQLNCLRRKRTRLLLDSPVTKIDVLSEKGRLTNWGQWTRCDTITNIRYRFKDCKKGSQNPNDCRVQTGTCPRDLSTTAAVTRFAASRRIPQKRGEAQCNPRENCCAFKKSDGSKDCKASRGGYKYILTGRRLKKSKCKKPIDCKRNR